MVAEFQSDPTGECEDVPHFCEYCDGGGHAALALRADGITAIRQEFAEGA